MGLFLHKYLVQLAFGNLYKLDDTHQLGNGV